MSDFSEFKKVYLTAMSLICPIGRRLMVDPVLISNGKTYERSDIEDFFEFQSFIGNRPIQDPSDSHKTLENLTIVPHNSIKSVIEQFVNTYESFQLPMGIPEQEEEQTNEQKDVLMEWEQLIELCKDYRVRTSQEINIEEEYERVYQTAQTLISPMSGQLMLDPVTISNGKTYDRFEIRDFFIASAGAMIGFYDPITNEQLSSASFIPDNTMNTLIKQFVEMYENKQGEEWEPVVHYCEVYKARRIEQAQKVQRQERERQARENQERIEEYRRNRQLFRTGFFTGYPPQTQNQLEEEARRRVERQNEEEEARQEEARQEEARRRREARRSNTVIDMDRRLAESAARRAATIRTEREMSKFYRKVLYITKK